MNTRTNEDLVQEALTVIYEKYKEVEFEKGILPWAYTVLDNVMKDDYKTETRRHTILTNQTDTILEIYGSSEPVEDKVGYQELVDEIRRALSQLSNKEKEIFELKLKGYSVEAIQNQLGLRRNTLDVRVFRGSKKLRRILEKKGVL